MRFHPYPFVRTAAYPCVPSSRSLWLESYLAMAASSLVSTEDPVYSASVTPPDHAFHSCRHYGLPPDNLSRNHTHHRIPRCGHFGRLLPFLF